MPETDAAPQRGDIVIWKHGDGCYEFFVGIRRVKSYRWEEIVADARREAAVNGGDVWTRSEDESPRRFLAHRPGESVD